MQHPKEHESIYEALDRYINGRFISILKKIKTTDTISDKDSFKSDDKSDEHDSSQPLNFDQDKQSSDSSNVDDDLLC